MPNAGTPRNSGFTLVELMVAISIVGIIAGWAAMSIASYVGEKFDERLMVGMWKDIKSTRMKAMKTEYSHIVDFSSGGLAYVISYDSLGTKKAIPGFAVPTTAQVGFGLPDPAPDNGPLGIAKVTGSSGISTSWANGLVFQKDFMGSVSAGAVYFHSLRSPRIGYCLFVEANSQDIKLYKYRGGSWFQL